MIPMLPTIVAQAEPALTLSWEAFNSILLSLTTIGAVWTARTVFVLRDAVRDLKNNVMGLGGVNGLNSKVKNHTERLNAIEDRNIALDTVAAIERQQYTGPEKRKDLRRLRDTLIPPLPPVDRGEGEEDL